MMRHLTSSLIIAALITISQAQWSSYKSHRNLPPAPPAPAAPQASSFTTKFYEFEQPVPPMYPQAPPYHAPSPMYPPPSNTIEDYSNLIKLVKTMSKTQSEKENSCNTGDIINKLIDALIVAVTGKNQSASARNYDTDE